MTSGQRRESPADSSSRAPLRRDEFHESSPQRLSCSNRSAEVLLVVLIMISLNVVACYDAILSCIFKVLSIFRRTGAPPTVEIRHRLGTSARKDAQTIAPMTSPWSISSRLR